MNEKETFMNYKRNNRWLGIMDYKTLMVLVICLIVFWNLLNLLSISLEYKMYIYISLSIPIVVLLCININGESGIDVILIIFKFSRKNKIFIDTNNLTVQDVNKNHKIFSKINKKIKKDCNHINLMI